MAFPSTYNINYYRGDTYKFEISPKTSDNEAFPLGGWSAILTIATSRGPSPAFSVSANVTKKDNGTPNPTTFICEISPTTGRQLEGGKQYVYDVQMTKGDEIYTLLTGTIFVTDDITGAGNG